MLSGLSDKGENMSRTLYDRIFDSRILFEDGDETVLFIDRHFLHEVTSPQAFEGLRLKNRKVKCPERCLATVDHNVSTQSKELDKVSDISRIQIQTLEKNCTDFNIPLIGFENSERGIVHVIGPELGLTLPGNTIVCGDSHTSTHGAFGALAFGIGTSEIEHVLCTQTLRTRKMKNFKIRFHGFLNQGVSAKDLALHIIRRIGTSGGQGYVIEFQGEALSSFSMESRMTLCNMSIEAGAKSAVIAPDRITFEYLYGREYCPFKDFNDFESACSDLHSDPDAVFDQEIEIYLDKIYPVVTWGINPAQSVQINESIPDPKTFADESEKKSAEYALAYMGLKPGMRVQDISIDKVFIGSCTNSRIEDLRKAASVMKGRKVHPEVKMLIVPGSRAVKKMAEQEGLDRIFIESGAEWRDSGCSLCLGMNDDSLKNGERLASTANRNFEGRQGKGARVHILSPELAAAAGILGHLGDLNDLAKNGV